MAKAPDLGRAKTRLARDIGPRAIVLCRLMLADTFAAARGPWRLVVAVAPRVGLWSWRRFWPKDAALIAQSGGDLGDRLTAVLSTIARGPVVVIGGDAPALRRRHLSAAFRALERADAVFGPATDGGFWLVGLARRRRAPELFRNVRWSTEHALGDAVDSVPEQFATLFLETLADVDDAGDLGALTLRSQAPRITLR